MAFANAVSWVSVQWEISQIVTILAILTALTTTASYFLTWYRLQHVPGPFLNSLTVLVQLREQWKGNFHLYLEELHQKYGKRYIPAQ